MTIPFNEAGLTPSSTVQAAQFVLDADGKWVPLTVAAGDPSKVAATVSITNPTLAVQGDFYPPVQDVRLIDPPPPVTSVEVSNLHDDQLVHAAGGFYPAVQAISGSVQVSNLPPPITSVEVSNFPPAPPPITSVAVSNFPQQPPVVFPDVQQVTGKFFPDMQRVVGDFYPETQAISGTVAVTNFPGYPAAIESRQHVLDPDTGQWVPSEVPASSGAQSLNKVQLVQITQAPPLSVQGVFWQNVQPTQDTQVIELLKQILTVLQAKA